MGNNQSFDWLDTQINTILSFDPDPQKYLKELSKLIYVILMGIDRHNDSEKYEFWMRNLLKYDNSIYEIDIMESYIHQVYGEDIRSADGYDTHIDGDFDIQLFMRLILDQDMMIAGKAAFFLAYVCGYYFLEELPSIIAYHQSHNHRINWEDLIVSPCELILDERTDVYYGSMCPGILSDAEIGDEFIAEEYELQKSLWLPLFDVIGTQNDLHNQFSEMLNDLSVYVKAENQSINPETKDPNQLEFGFE